MLPELEHNKRANGSIDLLLVEPHLDLVFARSERIY